MGHEKKTVFFYVGVAHNATVPSARGQLAKQMVTRMNMVF